MDLSVVHEGGRREVLRGLEFSPSFEYLPGFPRRAESSQVVAATAFDQLLVCDAVPGAGCRVRFQSSNVPLTGEQMTVDVLFRPFSGAYFSILVAPFVFAFGDPGVVYDLPLLPASSLPWVYPVAGGLFGIDRVYSPGVGPDDLKRTLVTIDYYGEGDIFA